MEAPTTTTTISSVIPDLIKGIFFRYIKGGDRASVTRTCKQWNQIGRIVFDKPNVEDFMNAVTLVNFDKAKLIVDHPKSRAVDFIKPLANRYLEYEPRIHFDTIFLREYELIPEFLKIIMNRITKDEDDEQQQQIKESDFDIFSIWHQDYKLLCQISTDIFMGEIQHIISYVLYSNTKVCKCLNIDKDGLFDIGVKMSNIGLMKAATENGASISNYLNQKPLNQYNVSMVFKRTGLSYIKEFTEIFIDQLVKCMECGLVIDEDTCVNVYADAVRFNHIEAAGLLHPYVKEFFYKYLPTPRHEEIDLVSSLQQFNEITQEIYTKKN
mgnify:CR=1 FL=1